ncbi:MAG: phosphonate ABC transporter, permease protein PhnE [Rhodospirillales bacterium]
MNETVYQSVLEEERRTWRRTAVLAGGIAAAVVISAGFTGLLDVPRLAEGLPAIGILISEMFPPQFTEWQSWIKPVVDTLAMSIAGTALAVLLSLPLAFLAAHNTTPGPVTYRLCRTLLNFLRSIPELIMGIVFVAAVGFGALPGVLALGLHSVGMVGKFFAEAIEHVDPRPVEAAAAAGASRFQIIQHAVLPQVLPQFSDVTIYRWEYNFRASTVMGMVGAGGIGFELMASLRILRYEEVSAILIVVLLMVTIVDSTGAALRRNLK